MNAFVSRGQKLLSRTPLTLRLFVLYAVLLVTGGVVVTGQVIDEVKPAVRQSTEETLVDTANLLAELVRDDLSRGTLQQSRLPEILERFGRRNPEAKIWGIKKSQVNHRVYVVDRQGRVVLDSTGKDVGKDYSRWNDVALTLHGKYGARTTKDDPNDELSTVMYVAAPVMDSGKIIGAVTVGKPNRTVEPFIHRARLKLMRLGALAAVVGLTLGAVLSIWLSQTIRQLTDFANTVAQGKRTEVPELPGNELRHLAESLESMRQELEGKGYVERYVHTLTHELKSPLSAIVGAAELLQDSPIGERNERLVSNIQTESSRLLSFTERLLRLAELEHRQSLEVSEPISIASLWADVLESLQTRAQAARIRLAADIPAGAEVLGDPFLIRQALTNLLENALDFTPAEGTVSFGAERGSEGMVLRVDNEGPAIPEYALARIPERFYSLPRPQTGRKSTGLGLSFVREVASLHGGTFHITNTPSGVRAELTLPQAGRSA